MVFEQKWESCVNISYSTHYINSTDFYIGDVCANEDAGDSRLRVRAYSVMGDW